MKDFMDEDFLLQTNTAKHLYHDYAADLPLIDYHCHISPREIYEDRRFESLDQIWLGGQNPDGSYAGDHYKWRLMRAHGISEKYITGNGHGRVRITKFAEALEMAIGNPMYHWCNLELKQFFDFHKPFSVATAAEVYDVCGKKLQKDPDLSARGIIRKANVAMIGTTDDPTDTLEWHGYIADDPTIEAAVYPSFRPDNAINIQKPGFVAYIAKLAESVGADSIASAQEVGEALLDRLDYFHFMGCRASDHGLEYVPFRPADAAEANRAFQKAMHGEMPSTEEVEGYQTYLLLQLGRAYKRMNIAMQIHYSCGRNVNARRFAAMGADAGYDIIAQNSCGMNIAALLSALDETDECPKTILYSLNPGDNALLGSLIGAFQTNELPGKIQHGSAWWFNDTLDGMEAQMRSLAALGILGNFVGMLTDSRSFLSYARHDYFRRILCNLVGRWVENGEYPNDERVLRKIIEGVCYNNAARYFNL